MIVWLSFGPVTVAELCPISPSPLAFLVKIMMTKPNCLLSQTGYKVILLLWVNRSQVPLNTSPWLALTDLLCILPGLGTVHVLVAVLVEFLPAIRTGFGKFAYKFLLLSTNIIIPLFFLWCWCTNLHTVLIISMIVWLSFGPVTVAELCPISPSPLAFLVKIMMTKPNCLLSQTGYKVILLLWVNRSQVPLNTSPWLALTDVLCIFPGLGTVHILVAVLVELPPAVRTGSCTGNFILARSRTLFSSIQWCWFCTCSGPLLFSICAARSNSCPLSPSSIHWTSYVILVRSWTLLSSI